MELTKTNNPQFILVPCHPYPTRWKLGRYASRKSSPSQESRADDEAKDEALVIPGKRRKKEKQIVYLPREIIFNILVRVPAQVVHDSVRYVCKLWSEIVKDPDFIRVHRQISPAGFLIQASVSYLPLYYIDAGTAGLKVTKIEILPWPARVLCCHNDLVLLPDSTNKEILHVVNLMTKVKISLPPMVGMGTYPGNVGLAIDSSGHYKVVCVGLTSNTHHFIMSVFTIGVDNAWRFMELQGIPFSSLVRMLMLYDSPHWFGGFIYWFGDRKSYLGLALDVNTETIYQFSKPNYLVQGDHPLYVIGIGMGVGLIYCPKPFTWTFWKLTDVKSGQWTELTYIDVRELYNQFSYVQDSGLYLRITPVRLFRGDLWFYGDLGGKFIVVRYNLSNKSFEVFPFKTPLLLSSDRPSSSKDMIFTQELVASPDL